MPNSATLRLKEFSGRLLALEGAAKPADAKDSAAFRVCEKLRGPLGKLAGVRGFASLLSRARALAAVEVAWLHRLHIRPDGSMEGLEALEAEVERKAFTRGEAELVAQLLGLLVTFIGPALTMALIREAWPKMENVSL